MVSRTEFHPSERTLAGRPSGNVRAPGPGRNRRHGAGWSGLARLVAVLGLLGLSGARGWAQEPEAPSGDPLDPVRELVALSSADLQLIDDWAASRIDELRQAVQAEPTAAAAAFREAFARQRRNPANSAEFSRQFAARAGAAFATEFGRQDPEGAAIVWPMARILLESDSFETRQALTIGLAHPVQAVRYLCAKTLAGLRNRIGADLNLARNTIALLGEAGVKEQNGVVLGALYEAMGYNEQVEEASRALADVFAARVNKRQTGQIAVADRAELLAWEFLKQVRNRIPDAEKVALARQIAAFLALDVNRSAAAEGDEKRIVEERIEVGEELLELLVGRGVGGDVRGAMTGGGPTADLDVKLELIKWVGAEGEQGALNKGPWNVPIGGLPAQP